MRVKRESKQELAEAVRERYGRAGRQEKGRILDEFVAATGYHRKYAVGVLRQGPRAAVAGVGRRGRLPVYGVEVLGALRVAAQATGWICGKRLAPALAELVPALEAEGAVSLTPDARRLLLGLSAATIDRRLAAERRSHKPHGLATTKPGSLLKRQIPIRTYTPWDEEQPGFMEIDLVAHCGTSTAGTYLCTLTMVDIATGWTECRALADKGQDSVYAAIKEVRTRLPFPLLGLDSDNGSEFINEKLLGYCRREQLTFTRCRAYRKNDQAHVEQKNWSVVRQEVGYDRYESAAALAQLRRVYELARVQINLVLPVMKLVGKEREGAKVRKRYDQPQTPYQRAVAAGVVAAATQAELQAVLAGQGPLSRRRALDAALAQLWRLRAGGQAIAASGS